MVATAGGETTSDLEPGKGQARRDAAMADLGGRERKLDTAGAHRNLEVGRIAARVAETSGRLSRRLGAFDSLSGRPRNFGCAKWQRPEAQSRVNCRGGGQERQLDTTGATADQQLTLDLADVRESLLLSWHAKRHVWTCTPVGPVLFVLGATPDDTAQLVTQQSHVQRSLTR